MQYALPALRADTALYRNYIYAPEPPLPVPIFAYGGHSDPNVASEHIEAWREQTLSTFTRREFAGGHFFINTAREEFLRTLLEDLKYTPTSNAPAV
jgi:surfactin synthase thioesterase subunit